MKTGALSISSPIEEKIAWAEYIYREFKGGLSEDEALVELLNRQRETIEASHKEMMANGIYAICRECEQNDGGSCCGKGLEDKYDVWLLLINLLLDSKLPRRRQDPESCFFLGHEGCLLKARHVICLNYLCNKVTARVDPQSIIALREKEGEELGTLFTLHERIKGAVRKIRV